ncbi:MAG: MerR family transcriptional regulator [Calditrichaeota bacterium]|nr:MerR family transcriptional regulator [Calditrichota bacterium]
MNHPVDYYEPVLTIGTVAKKIDVSVQTIRLYEQEGLVIPFKTDSGRRMYSMHDLDRLFCIRKMIAEDRMNLQGIKRILSFVPCWEFKGGLDKDCLNCPAYYEAEGPCWSLRNKGEKCILEDCRTCEVYRLDFHCDKIKKIIFGHERPQNETKDKNQTE